MSPLVFILLLLGGSACLIGGLMVLIAAFRQSVLWGLAYLFIPFASLVFICLHWAEAKIGFLVSLLGGILLIGGVLAAPDFRQSILKGHGFSSMKEPADPLAELDQKITALEARSASLQVELSQSAKKLTEDFRQLEAKRKALKPDDAAGIARFNEEAAAYTEQNAKRKQTHQEMTALTKEIEELKDQRSLVAARKRKEIVMYTTSTCGACKVAKEYFAKKGVQYQEIDVNQPEGRAEFQKLGGRGVPLILVKGKRMEGFNPQALDAML